MGLEETTSLSGLGSPPQLLVSSWTVIPMNCVRFLMHCICPAEGRMPDYDIDLYSVLIVTATMDELL